MQGINLLFVSSDPNQTSSVIPQPISSPSSSSTYTSSDPSPDLMSPLPSSPPPQPISTSETTIKNDDPTKVIVGVAVGVGGFLLLVAMIFLLLRCRRINR